MTDLGARTRQIGTFPVFLENISPAQNAGLPERLGPLGVVPTCIVRLIAFNTLRCSDIHARRERSTFLHKKRVPGLFFGLETDSRNFHSQFYAIQENNTSDEW